MDAIKIATEVTGSSGPTSASASLDELTPSARFMLGTALYEAGAVERAEPHFRTVVEKQPTSGPARVALAETLLSQANYAEAAEIAGGVEEESPWRPASLVTELVARMLAGDLESARTTLEHSGSSLPAEQRTTLLACVTVLLNRTPPPGVLVGVIWMASLGA